MTKKEFIVELRTKLNSLNVEEKEDIISYYDELISDKVDNGQNEEDVVDKLGGIDEVVRRLGIKPDVSTMDEPIFKKMRNYTSKSINKNNKVLIIILLALASPLIIGIGAGILGIIIGILGVLFGILVSIVSIIIALPIYGLISLLVGIANITTPFGVMTLGYGLFSVGLSLVLINPLISLLKYLWKQTKILIFYIKRKLFGGTKYEI